MPQCPENADSCPHVVTSAELAVKKVFAILGVDVDKPDKVEEFRENLRFGAHMRRAADRGMLAMVVVFCAGIMSAIWLGVYKMMGH